MTAAPLDVAVTGAGEPAVVLLPGWCCGRSTLGPLARLLQAHHRVLAIDWRGFGRSTSPPPGYDLDHTLADLRQTLAAAAPEGPVIVGHSLGGRVALALTSRCPELTRAVVLLDTVIEEPEARVEGRRKELDAPDWQRRLRTRFRQLQGAGLPDHAALIEHMLTTPLEVARSSLAVADAVDAPGSLAASKVPVLYVAASDPKGDRAQLRRLRPDVDYGQVVGSGHFLQLDVPEQVAPMIERFLRLRLPTPAGTGDAARPLAQAG